MKFEQLNSRTAGAFVATYYIVVGLAIGGKVWRTGEIGAGLVLACLFFVFAAVGFVVFRLNEDGDEMRFSMMQLLVAMTVISTGIAIVLLGA